MMLNRPARAQTGATDLGELLRSAYAMAPRRSLIFIVSDFISAPGWAEPLAHLAQRHDVVAVRLYDPLEMELPDLGMLVVQDAETGEQIFVDTHDRGFRRRFEAAAQGARGRAPLGVRQRGRGRARAVDRTTISSTRSCASPICASAGASSPPAAASRSISDARMSARLPKALMPRSAQRG